jgi:hypothetical protein
VNGGRGIGKIFLLIAEKAFEIMDAKNKKRKKLA